ncbi:leucine-rich repeat-containing protein 34-like, partial [Teleopsis dalmanni]|uniref:leucine-rich repeat-containing protein 34-like n=1 Tax=Teleopsis dalmanni TaxID=139649 RepID=UPI0018CCB21F
MTIFRDRHLQEFIENVQTSDYDQESVQETLDICAEYINQLEINFLQPSPDGQHNHIPLDFILSNLPELHTLRLTYCTKSLGMNFYLGCNTLSKRDVLHLARGLSRSHELLHFCLHSTKLSPYQLHPIARNLDRGCHNLTSLALVHCSFGNEGIRKFLQACNKESFSTLKILDLTNNKITAEGALLLSRSLRNLKLEKFILRFNPIQSDGAAIIFSLLNYLPIKYLDISCCCICVGITKLFMQLIVENKILRYLDVSNNELNEEFGVQLYKIIGFNKTLQMLDVRNTGLSFTLRNKLRDILKQ